MWKATRPQTPLPLPRRPGGTLPICLMLLHPDAQEGEARPPPSLPPPRKQKSRSSLSSRRWRRAGGGHRMQRHDGGRRHGEGPVGRVNGGGGTATAAATAAARGTDARPGRRHTVRGGGSCNAQNGPPVNARGLPHLLSLAGKGHSLESFRIHHKSHTQRKGTYICGRWNAMSAM